MKAEYLLLNLLIIAGPLALSFDSNVRYVRFWAKALASAVIVMIPFIVWDSAVSGVHWYFSDLYTLNIRLLGLPPGEYLFFITVPFSCLFIWQILVTKRRAREGRTDLPQKILAGLFIVSALLFFRAGRTYTGLVLAALSVTCVLDVLSGVRLLSRRVTGIYLSIVTGLMLVFNGYLTARPVVLYNSGYFLGIRVFTIPVEDFGYGFALILVCTIVFEVLKRRSRG